MSTTAPVVRPRAYVTARCSDDEKRRLEDVAARRGVSLSTLVRGAIVRVLQEAPSSHLVAG